ncbi:Arf family guanine nucleotide exchange factor [Maudiozyma humilis]|uniref:Guanine-nucleotide exchange factor YEL1 n=1 Tax=Maudiozyma humilis TaxID=51915 RepID=A0AAV5RYS6_MAUHU|nr:Arf family guanine nucleotide exchange factor [Kazachstania humilis]
MTEEDSVRQPSILVPRRRAPPTLNQSLDPLHPKNQFSNGSQAPMPLPYGGFGSLGREGALLGPAISRSSTLNSASAGSGEFGRLEKPLTPGTTVVSEKVEPEEPKEPKRSEAYHIASEIYRNTFQKYPYTGYADYLGQKDNAAVLREYIQLLRPLPVSLASVLIYLSSQLYFIAEAQNIDRILEQISKEWVAEHPDTKWEENYEIVHIILFSILILNSDLHNDNIIRGKNDKFSSRTFIDNTLYAIEKEVSRQYKEIDIDDIKQQAAVEFAEYYDILRNSPLPLFSGKRVSLMKQRRNSSGLSRHSSLRSVSHVRRFETADSQNSQRNSVDQTRLGPPAVATNRHSRSRSRSMNIGGALSRSNSVSSRKTVSSTFSKSTASWKYRHNQPLPQLYIKEDFDENLNRQNNTMWLMDDGIRINEVDLLKLTRKNKHQHSSSNSANNNSENESGSANAVSNTSLVSNSASSLTASATSVASAAKSHSLGLFKWFRRSKHKTLYQDAGKSMTYLDNTCRWVKARIRVSEGRIFIFRITPGAPTARAASSYNTKPKGALQSPPLSPGRVFSSPSSMSLPAAHNASAATNDTIQKDCLVLNLFECTASLVQENIITGSHSQKANFTLTFPRKINAVQTNLEFETGSYEEAQNYVDCLNFWAGRLSPVPVQQFEIVSNEEYGWSDRVIGDTPMTSMALSNVKLCEWKPLLTMELFYDHMDEIPGMIPLEEKIEELQVFTDKLRQLIDAHNDVKPLIVATWDRSPKFDRVMDNWNEKYLFLNSQYDKRIIYFGALQKAAGRIPQ